jgi:uncharacterized membrane protein
MIKTLLKIMWIFIGICIISVVLSLISHFSNYAFYTGISLIGFFIFGGLLITLLNKDEK